MVDLQLFRNLRLHFDHRLEEILEQLEFLTFAVKSFCIRVDRSDGELLGCWSILQTCQDVR